jgi:hypothetical protein
MISLVGKDPDEFWLETLKMFNEDAEVESYRL